MNLSRREALTRTGKTIFAVAASRYMLAAEAGAVAVSLEGCNIISDIENWVPVGIDSFNSLLSVLTSNGILLPPQVQLIANAVSAALTALEAAAKEYASTTPAPVGALQKLQTALKDVVDNFGTFLSALNLPGGNLFTLITDLAGVILSTIAGFINQLPAAPASIQASLDRVQIGGKPVVYTPKQRTRRAFKRDFNSGLDNAKKSGGLTVPTTAYLKLSFVEHF